MTELSKKDIHAHAQIVALFGRVEQSVRRRMLNALQALFREQPDSGPRFVDWPGRKLMELEFAAEKQQLRVDRMQLVGSRWCVVFTDIPTGIEITNGPYETADIAIECELARLLSKDKRP